RKLIDDLRFVLVVGACSALNEMESILHPFEMPQCPLAETSADLTKCRGKTFPENRAGHRIQMAACEIEGDRFVPIEFQVKRIAFGFKFPVPLAVGGNANVANGKSG